MKDLYQEYVEFWMDMFSEKVNIEEVSNAFQKLYHISLKEEYQHMIANEDESGFYTYYENYFQNAAEEIISGRMECNFNFGGFYFPYFVDIKKELLNWTILEDERLDSRMLIESAMQSAMSVMAPISTKVLVQEVHRLKNKGKLGNGTEEAKYKKFQELLFENSHYRKELYSLYPRMFELLHLRVKQFENFYKKIIADVLKIWEEMGTESVLEKIITAQGDTHNHGKSVAELKFRNGQKMIYKPRNLESEKAFMSLIKTYNKWVETGRELKVYQVISRKDYGVTEFVEHNIITECTGGLKYYFRCGELLALLYSLNATDMHYENLIASGEYPVLIDCETIISPYVSHHREELELLQKTESLKATCLLPVYVGKEGSKAEVGGIGTVRRQRAPFKSYRLNNKMRGDIELVYDYQEMESGKNNVGIPISQDGIKSMEQGFEYAYSQILEHKEIYLLQVKQLFGNIPIRIILRDTAVYSTMLGIMYHPDLLMDSVSQKVALCKDYLEQINKMDEKIYGMENRELLRGDIPYFYTYANQKSLYCGEEEISQYYEVSPIMQVLHKIDIMSEEDMKFQKVILERSYLEQKAEYEKDFTGFCFGEENSRNDSATEYLHLAQEILEIMLKKSFSFGKGKISWMDCMYADDPGMGVKYSYVGNDLYNGESGIGLVFLYYGIASGKKRYIDIAEKIADYGNELLEVYDKNHSYLIGAFSGLSGRLYFNSKLYLYTGKEIYKSCCIKLMQFINNIMPKDRMLDVISGSAGFLHVLCSIYEGTSDMMLKEKAVYYMECAAGFLISKFDRRDWGWKLNIEEKKSIYTGFGHGDSGIVAALARYDYNVRKMENKELINKVIENHRILFSQNQDGWYKNEDRRIIGYGWCHGSIGILLSRVLLKKYGYRDIDDDIEKAIEISLKKSFGSNMTLCHGDLGSLETMGIAGTLLNKENLVKQEGQGFEWLFENVLLKRYKGNCFRGTEVLGVMIGLAGYGYALVKQSCQKIPSILYLE